MTFRKHDIIDYYDSRRISCGLVLDVDDRRLRILNDQGKETKISANRALISGKDPNFPLSGSRDEQVNRLRDICTRREEIKKLIDLRELWEVVCLETGEIGIEDLAELFFGHQGDPNYAASLLRAIFEDRLYFKIRPDGIEVPGPEQVQQALVQREKER
jgi:exoribonuclease-2